MPRSPCGTSPQNGVLVNPDRFLPFSAFPNMYIVLLFQENKAPSFTPKGISMSTFKLVNPLRSYAGLRGLSWVVLFYIYSLYIVIPCFSILFRKSFNAAALSDCRIIHDKHVYDDWNTLYEKSHAGNKNLHGIFGLEIIGFS